MLCLSEPGLYFFLGRSDKEAALPFQKWVAGEVIPSIRKTGYYAVPQFQEKLGAKIAMQLAAIPTLVEQNRQMAKRIGELEYWHNVSMQEAQRHGKWIDDVECATRRCAERLEEALSSGHPSFAENDPEAKQSAQIRQFLVENLSITGRKVDYVLQHHLWVRYRDVTEKCGINANALFVYCKKIELDGVRITGRGQCKRLEGCLLTREKDF